jgi:hypothetical protein
MKTILKASSGGYVKQRMKSKNKFIPRLNTFIDYQHFRIIIVTE